MHAPLCITKYWWNRNTSFCLWSLWQQTEISVHTWYVNLRPVSVYAFFNMFSDTLYCCLMALCASITTWHPINFSATYAFRKDLWRTRLWAFGWDDLSLHYSFCSYACCWAKRYLLCLEGKRVVLWASWVLILLSELIDGEWVLFSLGSSTEGIDLAVQVEKTSVVHPLVSDLLSNIWLNDSLPPPHLPMVSCEGAVLLHFCMCCMLK